MYWYIYPILNIVIIAVSVFAGRFIVAHCSKKTQKIIMLVCVVSIVSFVFLVHDPFFIYLLSFFEGSVFLYNSWFFWFAIVFFVIALPFMTNKGTKRAITIFLVFIIAISAIDQISYLIPSNNSNIRGEIAGNGICLQSTSYTCGAASLATFLNIYDVKTTEIEMAKLARVRPFMGTSALGVYWALRHKLEETSFGSKIKNISFDELKQFDKPSIITTKLTFLVDHVIVVLGYEDGKFNIIDPLSGKYSIDEKELQEKWRGVVIYIE